MSRERAEEILEGWKSAAHSAGRPAEPPRPRRAGGLLPMAVAGAALVAFIAVSSLVIRVMSGPAVGNSLPPVGPTSPSPSPTATLAIRVEIDATRDNPQTDCSMEGGCAWFVGWRSNKSPASIEWRLTVGPSGLISPAAAPRWITPDHYVFFARQATVSDMGKPVPFGTSEYLMSQTSYCETDLTLSQWVAVVSVVVEFHSGRSCDISTWVMTHDPATQPGCGSLEPVGSSGLPSAALPSTACATPPLAGCQPEASPAPGSSPGCTFVPGLPPDLQASGAPSTP